MSLQLAYKDEQDIVDLAAQVDDAKVCFYPAESEVTHRFLTALRAGDFSKRERPDFEDRGASLLLESMIVDDHPRLDRKGKKDRTRMNEDEVLGELEAAGFNLGAHVTVVTNVSSRLPTEQDHNYKAYVEHFRKIVMKHARNTDIYRAEQPGYALGFMIFDESTAYFELAAELAREVSGRPHWWFSDAAFAQVIEESGADCFVWLTPYKLIQLEEGELAMPEMTIIDVALFREQEHLEYDLQRMVSSEE